MRVDWVGESSTQSISAIEDVLAVENDVVPFDRADVLEQGCVNAFLGDSPRSHRPRDLLGLPTDFETERSWPGV